MNYFVTGTDTDVGKTVACAWLMLHKGAHYWKPIQSGLVERDIDALQSITGLDQNRFFPSAYELTQPLSPHEAAKRDNVTISLNDFTLPQTDQNLIIEGAGGCMVPINDDHYVIDLIKHLNVPAIIVARSMLGTINHTLMTIETLQSHNIDIKGIIISGPLMPHNREALEQYGRIPIIAEIPQLEKLTPDALLAIKPEIAL